MSNVIDQIREMTPMVTPQEVAEKLRVSEKHVRNLCERGDIPGARRVGNVWRIPASYILDPAA